MLTVPVYIRGEGTTHWYACGACSQPVDVGDVYCRLCGARLSSVPEKDKGKPLPYDNNRPVCSLLLLNACARSINTRAEDCVRRYAAQRGTSFLKAARAFWRLVDAHSISIDEDDAGEYIIRTVRGGDANGAGPDVLPGKASR